jgi:O-6-methylguanine DNA methyltransferase
MEFLAKGKRSNVFRTMYKGKQAVIKLQREDTGANNVLQREYYILKKLNLHNIGPKVYEFRSGLVMEYLEGPTIAGFIKTADKKRMLEVLKGVLLKLRKLDQLGYSKQELTNPYKHIIITEHGPRLLDFERARFTQRPSNVTQFLAYLQRKDVSMALAAKAIFIVPYKLKPLAIKYKSNPSDKAFERLFSEVMQHGFASKVYAAAASIPSGKVASYKALAAAADSRAYRAVGRAMHMNPFWPIVPCHRVVSADRTIGGFRSGKEKKLQLLKKEGIVLAGKKIPKQRFIASVQQELSCS